MIRKKIEKVEHLKDLALGGTVEGEIINSAKKSQ